MSELKDLMTNVYAEMSTTDDVDAMVDKYFSADFVEHDTIPGIDAEGRELARVMFGMMKSGMPDIRVEVDMMVEEGNKVAAFGAFVGTFTGEMMGMAGQGQQVRMPFADLLEWRDGQLIAHWGVSDMSALFAPTS
jgi:predicted ester cyclase